MQSVRRSSTSRASECHGLTENSYVNPDRKNCRDGFNFSERLATSRNQEEATASSCLNVVTPMILIAYATLRHYILTIPG